MNFDMLAYGQASLRLRKALGSVLAFHTFLSLMRIPWDLGVRVCILILCHNAYPDWKEPVGTGIVLCFKQESPKKVDELYKKITEAGFQHIKKPWDAFWGQRYSSVLDPDGNQIDLFASL